MYRTLHNLMCYSTVVALGELNWIRITRIIVYQKYTDESIPIHDLLLLWGTYDHSDLGSLILSRIIQNVSPLDSSL